MVRLTFLGHATVCLRLGDVVLLTDPVLRPHLAFLRWTAPDQRSVPLADVTATLISHLHHDHCDLPSLVALGRDRTLLVPAAAERFFRRHGFTAVVPMHEGETQDIAGVAVTATPAAHSGRREPFGPRAEAMGFLLAGDGSRLYFAGDTDLFPAMSALASPDVALLPVAGWGRTLGPGHLDPVRAAEAVRRIAPRIAIPIHWGALQPVWHRRAGADTASAPARTFDTEVRRGGSPTEVVVIRPGETVGLSR